MPWAMVVPNGTFGRPLRVDMDPVIVARQAGEIVDHLLADGDLVAPAGEVRFERGLQRRDIAIIDPESLTFVARFLWPSYAASTRKPVRLRYRKSRNRGRPALEPRIALASIQTDVAAPRSLPFAVRGAASPSPSPPTHRGQFPTTVDDAPITNETIWRWGRGTEADSPARRNQKKARRPPVRCSSSLPCAAPDRPFVRRFPRAASVPCRPWLAAP